MSRIFITGSSTGLGLIAANELADQGHQLVLHARNAARAKDARRELSKVEAVVIGDLETIAGDAVIHNATVGYREGHRITPDRLPHVFAIHPDRID